MKDCVWFSLWTLLMVLSGANAMSSSVIDARLVNGDRCSGHLEMKHQDQWRTLILRPGLKVSRFYYAEMACHQMGCGSVVSFNHQVNTTVSRRAWEVHFSCSVKKWTIHECREAATRQTVKDIESTLSSTFVECSEYLRIGSFLSCTGKVLVRSEENWVHVCKSDDKENDDLLGQMMCTELGCGNKKTIRHVSPGDDMESKIIRCHGNETHIQECPSFAHSNCSRVLQIDCHQPFSVRLVGESRCRGRLEGKIIREWRPLTPSWFRLTDIQSMTICELAGCGGFVSLMYEHHNQQFPIWEVDGECKSEHFCSDWNDKESRHELYFVCAESLRLFHSYKKCVGHVQVRHGGAWRSFCQDEFSLHHSFMGCRELECGFPQAKRIERYVAEYNSALRLNCRGDEERLADCPESPRESSLPAEGSHEMCVVAYLNCGMNPMTPEMTIFSQLAVVDQNVIHVYSGHRVLIICSIDSPYPVRSFQITKQDNPNLNGTLSVDNSAQFVFEEIEDNQGGKYYCRYDYEFSPDVFSGYAHVILRVKESSYVRLVGRESRCLGVLELQHEDKWKPVSQRNWGLKEGAVVCRQLGCGSVISSESQNTELQSVWKLYSDCDGSERALLNCGSVRKWMSSDAVHVLCSDIVAKPAITVFTDRLYPENTAHVVAHEGHSFLLNCAVEPLFYGGHFSLKFFGSEMDKVTEAVLNYSAIFKFSHITKNQSGNYTCIYHNRVSQHDFTIESKTVTVTVEDFGEIKLDDGLQHDDGSKVCSGTLLMSKGPSQMKMVTAESSGWDLRQASVVCRELGCGNVISTSKIQFETFKPTWRFFSDCEGSEDALLMCGHIEESFSNSAIQVFCAGQS